MLQRYPEAESDWQDDDAEAELEWVKKFILGIRQIRGEMDISPGKSLPVLLLDSSDSDRLFAERNALLLRRVGRVESVQALESGEEPPLSATALLGNMRILVPMAGIIDVSAEKARISKQRERMAADLQRSQGKLSNEKFVNNAPADVVTQEKQRVTEFERQISQLDEQLQRLDTLND
jgi:valyl-tRNA synthetase